METLTRRESCGPVSAGELWEELYGNNGPHLCFHVLFLRLRASQARLTRSALWGPNPFFFLFPDGIHDQLLFVVDRGWNQR